MENEQQTMAKIVKLTEYFSEARTEVAPSDNVPKKYETVPHTPSYAKSYCQTQFKSDIFDFIWRLDRWSRLCKVADVIISMPFPETAQYKIQMQISYAPNWWDSDIKFYILTDTTFKGTCDVATIHTNNRVIHKTTWGFIKNMTLLMETKASALFEQTDKDALIMIFTFEIFHQIEIETFHLNPVSSPLIEIANLKPLNSISDDTSYDTKSIIITINDEQYNVSKNLLRVTKNNYFERNVLRAISDTSNTCNESSMTDENKNVTFKTKNNDEQDAIKMMLSYVRTGLIPILIEYNTLKNLFKLANECKMQDLKLLCEQHLLHRITINTAIDLVQFAFTYDTKCLQEQVIAFIKYHIHEIVSIKEFQLLPQDIINKIIELIGKLEISKEVILI